MTNVKLIKLGTSFYVRIPKEIMDSQNFFLGTMFEMTEEGDGTLRLERQVTLRAAPRGKVWALATEDGLDERHRP